MDLLYFQVVGGDGLCVMLPKWSPDDKLMYIHDKTNWWNLYKLEDDIESNLHPKHKEIGEPAWTFAGSPYSCNPTKNGDTLFICDAVCFRKYYNYHFFVIGIKNK